MPKPLDQQLAESDAMLAARDKSAQTPEAVRKAFLARARTVGPVTLQPFNLGIMWLLEELHHPFDAGSPPVLNDDGTPRLDDQGKPLTQPLSLRDIARAIYIFSDPESAAEALANDVRELDAAAMQLASAIAPAQIKPITEAIQKLYAEGLATIPGAGAGDPPAPAAPSAPSAMPDSAGP